MVKYYEKYHSKCTEMYCLKIKILKIEDNQNIILKADDLITTREI